MTKNSFTTAEMDDEMADIEEDPGGWVLQQLLEDDDMLNLYMTELVNPADGNDSDDSEEVPVWGGSTPGRRVINRNRIFYGQLLMQDYFDDNCTYTDNQFHCCF